MKSIALLRRKTLATAIAVAFAGGHAGTVLAQNAPVAEKDGATDRDGVTTVVVTAQGRKENVLKIPYNISAVRGTDLEDNNITSSVDMLREVAGASVVSRDARTSGVVSDVIIRGLNVTPAAEGDFQLSTTPTVSTYVNNTPIFADFILKDIERVEILRGPQGTLYGAGSLGGTVRYLMNEPDPSGFSGKVEASVSKTYNSGGENNSEDIVLNVPLGSNVAFRLSAGKEYDAGFIDYANVYVLDAKGNPVAPNGILNAAALTHSVPDANWSKIIYDRLSVLAKPTNDLKLELSYQRQSNNVGSGGDPTIGVNGNGVAYGAYQFGGTTLEPAGRDAYLTALEADYDLGFATLSSNTSHYHQEGWSLGDNAGLYANHGFLAADYYNYPRPNPVAYRTSGDSAFVEEVRLVSKTGHTFDYVLGAYYQNQNLNATDYDHINGFTQWAAAAFPAAADYYNGLAGNTDFQYSRAQNFRDRAIYGNLTWNVTPAVRITGGVRSFRDDFNNLTLMAPGLNPPYNVVTPLVVNQPDSRNLFMGNVSWDIAPKQMLYATVSQGYRRGGTNAVPTTGAFAETDALAWQSYKPDTDVNSEIGIKGANGDLRYNFSLYDIRWHDIQLDTQTPIWGWFAAQNGGTADSRGLEVELSGKFLQNWRYTVNYTYTDAKLTEDLYTPGTHLLEAPSGTQLPSVPRNSLSGSLAHVSMFDNGWYWTNRVNASYQSSVTNSILTVGSQLITNAQTFGGFALFNLSSTLAGENWSGTFFVKNLTNQLGVSGAFTNASFGANPGASFYGSDAKVMIAQPRTIGFSGRYNF